MRRYKTAQRNRIIGAVCDGPAKGVRSWGEKVFYVESLPGQGGKDWGYTESATYAMLLTRYWQIRFRANVRDNSSTDAVWFIEHKG